MTTLYPSRIDGYSQIRVVRDVTGEILAKDHNDLRSAILSIERTLGINPQKDFGTFVARLDDSYNIIQAHAHSGIPKHIDSHIYTNEKIGTVDSLPLGTVKTQVQRSLDHINYIHSVSGASSIGTVGFSTEKNNYVVYSNNVQSQIQEIGGFLDKNVDFLGTSFDSHVIDGMLVSSTDVVNLTVSVTAGFISSQGMQIKSSAQSGLLLLSDPGDGVYYVCASRNTNAVVIIGVSEDDLSNILVAPNSIIILAEVVLDSSTVTVTDMRRFGVFVNDKNGFTVGSAPINGNDGYGCDFLTLKTAVKHITLMKGSGKFINGSKITLVSDIIIDDELYAEIELPDNIEIDGCGHSIIYSAVASLFIINSDSVTVKNLVIAPNFAMPYNTGSFSRAATTSNVSNLKITDCVIEGSGIAGADLEYLILIGDIPGAYSVNGAIIRNNNVAVRQSGITFRSLGARLNNAIIEGNTIYHTYMESTSSYVGGAITAGSYCKVINNFIHGGYDIGIIIHEGLYTDVQGNTIIGTDEVVYYMNKGILFNNSSSPAVSICIASNNIIHGVNTFGINCSYGTGYNSFMIVDSNIIDNKVEGVLQPVNMCSIFSNNLSETIVSNNMILYPGLNSHAIEGPGNVIGNYIYCTSEPSSTYDIFSIFVSNCPNAFISQNIILNCDGSGISMDIGCLGTTVIDNLIHNIFSQSSFSESSYSIYANADYMAVINNTVVGSELGAINRIAISCTGDKSIICGNAIHNMSNIGITTTGIKGVISNNILTEVLYGINCNNSESCAIKDNIILTDTRLNFISSQDAIYDVGSFSAVEGNYIYGFGQDSETNKLIQCTGNRSTVVANNYVVFCKGIGIDCLVVEDCKIYNNYIYCSYNAISTGNRNEVINNMIISPENYGIFVGGNNNHIYGNRIINSLNSCIYIRALPDMDTNEVVINHNYLYNSLYDCVYMRDVSSGLIFGNYIAMAHSFDSEVCLIKAHSCLNLLITGNYIINSNVGRVDGILTYGIYFSGCQNCAVNSNYLESSEESFFTGIYLDGSYQAMVSSNYITNASKYAIHMNSFSVLNRSNSIISGNYIYSSIPCMCGILLSNIIIASVFGNQVYVVGSGSIGIDVGNTTGNSILLSSNMVTTTNNETSVVFSGIGIKVIGNIAIGGLAPNASYWDGGYSNSNANNVWDDDSVIPE